MNRFFIAAGALIVVMALMPSNADAAINETMLGQMEESLTDIFLCPARFDAGCNLHIRYYGDLEPTEINGPAAPIEGFPWWRAKPLRYKGLILPTGNFPIASNNRCEAWYQVWDGATDPGLETYISYYGSKSTFINDSEGGVSANAVDCGGNTGSIACFGALDTTLSQGASGSAQGALSAQGGFTPVPVPTVVTNGALSNVATLSVDAVNVGNNLNLPSKESIPCTSDGTPGGIPTFFNELVLDEAPGATWGIGLYVYSLPAGDAFRNLLDLEGTTNLHTMMTNPSNGMACTDNDATGDCPGVGFIPCSSLGGGATCVGDLLAPGGGSFDVSSPVVDAALGAPLGENVAVFLTKVHYRGSVAGSHANPGNTSVNGSLVSLFSAASTRVSYSALAARVSFTRIDASGNRVVIDFQTVGGSFVEFTIQRADDGVSFVDLGTVAATGETDYSFTDTIRGRRPASATYRIIAEDFNGNLTQIFQSVDLSVKPSRGRSRR